MVLVSRVSAFFRHCGPGLRVAALAAAAGLAWGVTAPAPASAAPTDWRLACQDKAAPQGYGESIRYNNCVRQRDCERLANQDGGTVVAMGCFGVRPDAPDASSRPPR